MNTERIIDCKDIQIIDGDRGKNYPSKNELFEEGFCLFLNAGNVTTNGFEFQNNSFISQEKDSLLRNGKLQRNDIVLTTRGTVGNVGFYDNKIKYNNLRINSGMVIIRTNESSFYPKFLYYNFISNFVQEQMKSIKTGSAQPQLPITLINQLKIYTTKIEEQKAIANVLSSFDDKIKNNNTIIKNLEEQAQALYKQWFVDFEFPDENGKPYKSNGGKFKYTELGNIPENWDVCCLGDLIIKNNVSLKDKKNWEMLEIIDLSIMPQFSLNIANTSKGMDFSTNIYKLNKYDLLFGSIRSYFGKAGFSPINGGVTGTVHCFLPKDSNLYSYILTTITNKIFIDKTVKLSTGTKMPIINWESFCSIIIPVSQQKFIETEFNNKIIVVIQQICSLIEENQKLKETRDYLLPKLMSGEIKVGN